MTSAEILEKILFDLKKIGGIEASAIASRDGLLIASSGYSKRAETFAAMSATMLGAAEIAMTELGKSIPDRVIVESNRGKIIAIGAGPGALLIVMAEADASIELMFVELKKAAEKIKEVLGLTGSGSPA